MISTTPAPDTTPPPVPTIDTKPTNPSTDLRPTLTFSDAEAGVTFACTLGTVAVGCAGGSFTPAVDLTLGQHTFAVTASDAVPNTSAAASSPGPSRRPTPAAEAAPRTPPT